MFSFELLMAARVKEVFPTAEVSLRALVSSRSKD